MLKKFLSSADTKANFTFLGIFSIGYKNSFLNKNSAKREPSPYKAYLSLKVNNPLTVYNQVNL